MAIVLIIKALQATGEEVIIAELESMNDKVIADSLFNNYLTTKSALNGQTLVYQYHPDSTNSHIKALSKQLLSLQTAFGYTSLKGELNSNLAISSSMGFVKDVTDKWIKKSTECNFSESVATAVIDGETKLRKMVRDFNERIHGLGIPKYIEFKVYIDWDTRTGAKGTLSKVTQDANAKEEKQS